MFKQGEIIEVETGSTTYKGVFIKEEKDFLVIKLDNGYNIGVAKRSIKESKSEGKVAAKEAHKAKEKINHNLPAISLLHTGGTIASKVDYETGAVLAKFTPEDIIELFPELKEIAAVQSTLIANMLSENMRFNQYNIIAEAIKEEAGKGVKGIIVTHGTDTLHYTAAALSFMLENIHIPVVLVGSQRSSDRPSSDAAVNLISAALFITHSKMPGVFICMHESMNDDKCVIIEGVNARKMHTSRRDAFKAINKGLIAKIDYNNKSIEMIRAAVNNNNDKNRLEVKSFNDKIKIGMIKARPGMHAEELKCYENYDGLIIEGTGLGHIGIDDADEHSHDNEKIKKELESLAKKMPVAMTSQTIYGRINMNVYSTGRELKEMGIIGNYCDMTPETAYIKLAWLLSNHKKDNKNNNEEIKKLFETNLRGEISERSEKEEF